MRLMQGIPELEQGPLVFREEKVEEATAERLLRLVIDKAKEVAGVIADVYKGEWTTSPSTGIRAVYGYWLVNVMRHFRATICLCEENDLSTVADVHHRQIFELYLQVRYYASLDLNAKEKHAKKMYAIGCIDYLEKMSVLKEHEQIRTSFEEVSDALAQFDKELVDEIKEEQKKRQFNWFGRTFSKLADDVNRSGEDLKRAYQIISADIHGTWSLALDVRNPKPGHLDFRGYPDVTTMYIRTAEKIYQVIALYLNLWNEIAKSVGAQSVFFSSEI